MSQRIFITGGTGYMGSRLIPRLSAQGYEVVALVRRGSERKLPAACTPVWEMRSTARLIEEHLAGCDTFIQLVGVAHPSPAKRRSLR